MTPISRRRTTVLATLLLATGCNDQGFSVVDDITQGGDPQVDVFPLQLDFGRLAADDMETATFTVANRGYAPLDVDEIRIEGDGGFTFLSTNLSFPLEPDQEEEIEVAFSPLGADMQLAQAIVVSNDPKRPEVPVSLAGEGRVPMLAISPDPHDFGTVGTGCADEVELSLQNIGAEELVIDDLVHTDADGLSARWESFSETLPLSLGPGDYTTLVIDFAPSGPGAVTGTLTVDSNDPRGVLSATQSGTGTSTSERTETFTATIDPPVDILFAVDRSGSMEDDAASLAANFEAFIDGVEDVTEGWQVGVVTLDEGCVNGGVFDSDTAGLSAAFEDAVTTGEDGDIVNDEALLQMADRALQLTGSGDCNGELLREGAPLHIIVVSDEPERSTEHAAAWTWDYWVERLQGYVSSPEQLVISGVVDTEDCNEGDDGYAEAISETNGSALSICTGDWADHVAALADISVTGAWSLTLDEVPAVDTIVVLVDGEEVDGWTYDADTNTVVLDGLQGGEEVAISYTVADECS